MALEPSANCTKAVESEDNIEYKAFGADTRLWIPVHHDANSNPDPS